MIKRNMTTLRKLMLLNGAIGGIFSEDTAIGNPLTFVTNVAKPLKSLLIPFTPQQSGTGDPSPENIRSILPWDGLTVFGGGKNLLNPAKYIFNTNTSRGLTFEVQSDGSVKVTGTTESSDFGPTLSARFQLPAGTYYGYRDDGDVYIAYRKATSESGGGSTGLISPFTLDGSEWVYCNIYVRNSGTFDTILHPQIARENAQSAYESYRPITETDIVFPSPVYGGTLDVVSGVLTVEWWSITPKWKDKWYGAELTNVERRAFIIPNELAVQTSNYYNSHKSEILCNRAKWNWSFNDDSVHFYTAEDQGKHVAMVFQPIGTDEETEIQIIGTLATPQTVTLTPAQLTALVGNNTIWSDADGSMTAVYLKKG